MTNHQGDRLLLLPDIAAILRSSVKTVRRRIESGNLTAAFKEGGRWVMWQSDLWRYLGKSHGGPANV